jgi:hypothetical protein
LNVLEVLPHVARCRRCSTPTAKES